MITPPDSWTTVQLIPPGPGCRWIGVLDVPNRTAYVYEVTYMALQQLEAVEDDGEGGDEVVTVGNRVVPMVALPEGELRAFARDNGLACFNDDQAKCEEHAVRVLRAFVGGAAAPAPAPAAETPSSSSEGGPNAA